MDDYSVFDKVPELDAAMEEVKAVMDKYRIDMPAAIEIVKIAALKNLAFHVATR